MFEVVEHTADVAIAASGRDAAEAFAEAAQGLLAIVLAEPEAVRERESRRVEVTAPDEEALLVAWLDEILFLQEAEGFLVRRVEVRRMAPTGLEAIAHGEPFDPARHRIATQVKGATYHQLRVEHDRGCRLQVILDV